MTSLQDIVAAMQGESYQVGDNVVLTEDCENDERWFVEGHIFEIIAIHDDLLYLEDDDGNELIVWGKFVELI